MFIFGLVVALLVILLRFSLRHASTRSRSPLNLSQIEFRRESITYMPQIRQSLSESDFIYLRSMQSARLSRRVRSERNAIASSYLLAVHTDFRRLMRIASSIAVLSPEIAAAHEFERLRLTLRFTLLLKMLQWNLLWHTASLERFEELIEIVGGLGCRLESAMAEMNERAAVAADPASTRH